MTQGQDEKQSIEIYYQMTQMLKLGGKNFKVATTICS